MILEIIVSSEVIKASSLCGFDNNGNAAPFKVLPLDRQPATNCAIALAVRDIFPEADIGEEMIYPFGSGDRSRDTKQIPMPYEAVSFIEKFDVSTPGRRGSMKPFSFKIDIPDHIIDDIPLPDINKIINESKTLKIHEHKTECTAS